MTKNKILNEIIRGVGDLYSIHDEGISGRREKAIQILEYLTQIIPELTCQHCGEGLITEEDGDVWKI